MNTPEPHQSQGTAIGFGIIALVTAFFFWAAIADVDPGRLLGQLVLIPVILLALLAAIGLLLAAVAILIRLLNRLLGPN